jgi:hypothetical protein
MVTCMSLEHSWHMKKLLILNSEKKPAIKLCHQQQMIPILSRIRIVDYLRIIGCLVIFICEFLLRIVMFFFPASFVDWIRYRVFG